MNRQKLIRKMVSLFMTAGLILFISFSAFAEDLPPSPPGNPDQQAPIDGGVAVLILAGVVYGWLRIKEAALQNTKAAGFSKSRK